jgi:hypothetical protein
MGLSRRYEPEHAPGEICAFGMDFSPILAPGVGLSSGSLTVFSNVAVPVDARADWQIGTVGVWGRVVYAVLSGGVEGRDYQLRWVAMDTDGNVWPRTALVLCAATS